MIVACELPESYRKASALEAEKNGEEISGQRKPTGYMATGTHSFQPI